MASFDGLLAKVVSQHSDVFGADRLLKCAQYVAALLAVMLDAAGRRAAKVATAGPAALARRPLLNAVAVAVARVLSECLPSDFSMGLRQFARQISTARLAGHFCGGGFGVPAELENWLTGSWVGGWCDPHVRWCVRLQSLLNAVIYYPLEHVAFLGAAAPGLWPERWRRPSSAALPMDGGLIDAVGRWSCKVWLLWLVAELYATHRRFQELAQVEGAVRAAGRSRPPEQETVCSLQACGTSRRALRLYLLRLCLFLPQAACWAARPSGSDCLAPFRLSEAAMQGLGLAEALAAYYAQWRGLWISRPTLPRDGPEAAAKGGGDEAKAGESGCTTS